MDKLFKTLDSLQDLLKNFNASIKMPKMSTPKVNASKQPAAPKLPSGPGPNSKKDPAKVADQLKNKELKPSIKPVQMLKVDKNGQWKL